MTNNMVDKRRLKTFDVLFLEMGYFQQMGTSRFKCRLKHYSEEELREGIKKCEYPAYIKPEDKILSIKQVKANSEFTRPKKGGE